MRLPNGFGSVHKISGNRRRPYRARITIGWKYTKEKIKIQEYKTIGYYATKQEGLIALVKNMIVLNFQHLLIKNL